MNQAVKIQTVGAIQANAKTAIADPKATKVIMIMLALVFEPEFEPQATAGTRPHGSKVLGMVGRSSVKMRTVNNDAKRAGTGVRGARTRRTPNEASARTTRQNERTRTSRGTTRAHNYFLAAAAMRAFFFMLLLTFLLSALAAFAASGFALSYS